MESPGNRLLAGALIRRERLRRDWSQEGLCKGICTVSYLSKIEQGKAEGSGEVLRLLLERLDVPWYEDQETLAAGEKWVERCYEAVLSYEPENHGDLAPEFDALASRLSNSPYGLDVAVLRGFIHPEQTVEDTELEEYLDRRQLALCCEKLGLTSQALEVLDRVDEMDWNFELGRQMCHLVRYRLEHPDYLHHPEYGAQLLQVFQDCRTQLPISFAAFHLPWVLEWYSANRQYRSAYELLWEFPIKLEL